MITANRNIVFDIAKGVVIILMVAAHVDCPCKNFINLFHMAFFFIIAGYFFNESHCQNFESITKYIKKKWKRLAVPFIVFNSLFLILNNLFIKLNIYTNNPDILSLGIKGTLNIQSHILTLKEIVLNLFYYTLLSSGTQLGSATWFLRTLFWVTVSYGFGFYLFKKLNLKTNIFTVINFVIVIICAFIGLILQKQNFIFYNIGSIFTSIYLFYIGVLIKKYFEEKIITTINFIISFVILLSAYLCGNYINLGRNLYPNLILLTIFSISGYIFIMYISQFLSKNKFLATPLTYIGQNTMPIICLQFLAFKLVNLLEINYLSLPNYYLASFPYLYPRPYWWILYTIIGCTIPILLNYIYQKTKQFICNCKSNNT